MKQLSGSKRLLTPGICCLFRVCLTPILSEWRCERPLIVCSSRLTGFRSGKRDGSSTYCSRKQGQKQTRWFCFFNEKTEKKKRKTKQDAGDKHAADNLLQGGGAQLDGDVSEEAVPLRAEISDDVGVRVRLSEQLHLPLGHLETLRQDPLDGDAAPVELPPDVEKETFQKPFRGAEFAQSGGETHQRVFGNEEKLKVFF